MNNKKKNFIEILHGLLERIEILHDLFRELDLLPHLSLQKKLLLNIIEKTFNMTLTDQQHNFVLRELKKKKL